MCIMAECVQTMRARARRNFEHRGKDDGDGRGGGKDG